MTSSRAERLLTLPPLHALVTLALPTTAVMVLGAMSGIVNTYFVARLGADAIAALSLVFPVNLIMLTMMGGGIGSGVSAAVAQALGAGAAMTPSVSPSTPSCCAPCCRSC